MNTYYLRKIRKSLMRDLKNDYLPMSLFEKLLRIRAHSSNKKLTKDNYWIHFDWVYIRYSLNTDMKYRRLKEVKQRKKVGFK